MRDGCVLRVAYCVLRVQVGPRGLRLTTYFVVRLWTLDFGLWTLDPFECQDLFDDFIRAQITLPALQPAGAELTAIGAADLRGDTKRVAVAGFAIERGIGRDEDALNEGMITQSPEKFLRGIVSALFENQLQ